jgi:hypothetical protein
MARGDKAQLSATAINEINHHAIWIALGLLQPP